ncbi:MAG: hypothetical protein ABIW76_21120 [Fibrobacteria bacterium]
MEKQIRDPESRIFTKAGLAKIEKREHPFFKNYMDDASTSEEVRENLILVLHSINQPWCFSYYLAFMKDRSYSIRMLAADGMMLLDSAANPMKILPEIKRINSEKHELRDRVVIPLVLSVGNSRDSKALEPLVELFEYERSMSVGRESWMPDVLGSFQKATAKLGFLKTVREIERELISGTGRERFKALEKVEYLNDPVWIDKIKPLLLDEEIGWSAPMGPYTATHRVCDQTVHVLRIMDGSSKIKIRELVRGQEYSDEELDAVRKAYEVLPK